MRRSAVLTLAAALGAAVLTATAAQAEPSGVRSVMFVGNNWDGTATIPSESARSGRRGTAGELTRDQVALIAAQATASPPVRAFMRFRRRAQL
jgi:hypothetical protein